VIIFFLDGVGNINRTMGKVRITKIDEKPDGILVEFIFIQPGHELHGKERSLFFEPNATPERIIAYLNWLAKEYGITPLPPEKRRKVKGLEGKEIEVE